MEAVRPTLIFGFGMGLRLALIARFPVIFGGDPMLRLLHRDRVLISHQLPLLQLVIVAISQVTLNYIVVMSAMAAIGAMVGVAFYLLARDLVEEPAAFLAGLMMTTAPMVAAHSIVPYQESLMLVCVLLAFHYFYAERYLVSSIWLALGCLTRFEAWIAAPVLAAAYLWRRGWKPAEMARAVVLFGWAPLAWMTFRRGLAPEGSYVVDLHFNFARLMRWVYLGYITAKFLPVIVLALGLAGVWFLWRDRAKWVPRVWPLALFVAMFSVAILFSAHGEPVDPNGRVASREAHMWMAAVVLLATVALEQAGRYRLPLAAVGIAAGMWGADRYVAREASEPRVDLSYRLAKFFDRELQPGERALILSKPWDRSVYDYYLQEARETGGESGYRAAVRNLAEIADLSPPDYQRTLVHSRFDHSRLLYESTGCTEWIAVWSDDALAPRDVPPAVETLRAANLSVRISKRVCPR